MISCACYAYILSDMRRLFVPWTRSIAHDTGTILPESHSLCCTALHRTIAGNEQLVKKILHIIESNNNHVFQNSWHTITVYLITIQDKPNSACTCVFCDSINADVLTIVIHGTFIDFYNI